jgi:hypothetical protein
MMLTRSRSMKLIHRLLMITLMLALGGAIDLATVQKPEAAVKGDNAKDVARKFLKENRLI